MVIRYIEKWYLTLIVLKYYKHLKETIRFHTSHNTKRGGTNGHEIHRKMASLQVLQAFERDYPISYFTQHTRGEIEEYGQS